MIKLMRKIYFNESYSDNKYFIELIDIIFSTIIFFSTHETVCKETRIDEKCNFCQCNKFKTK